MNISILMSIDSPWARTIAMKIKQAGHEIHIIDFDDAAAKDQYLNKKDSIQANEIREFLNVADSVEILYSKLKSRLKYLLFKKRLNQILLKNETQILLTLYGGGYGLMAHLSGFTPYVNYVVGSDVLVMNAVKKIIVPRMLKKAAIVFCNGKYLAGQTRKLEPRSNAIPLYIGINTKRFKPVSRKKQNITHIVCTRGFAPVYNNENIILALAEWKDDYEDITLTFTSKGPSLDGAIKLADQVLSKKMRSKVNFLGGVSSEDLLENLQNADIYISMSRSDGASISLMEAMGCGVYPIISDIEPHKEWLIDNNVSLVTLDRPEELAKRINDIAADVKTRRKAVEFNRKLMEEQCDINRNIGIMLQQMSHLL